MRNERTLQRLARRTALVGIVVGVALLASGRLLAAEPDNPHVWKSRVTNVAVFKNGLGFFTRAGEVSLRDGWCVAEAVPPAAFGTLAIYAHDEGAIVDVVGSGPGEIVAFDGVDAPDTEDARRARLAAATDLKVQLTYRKNEQDLSAAGKLISVGQKFAILQSDSNNFAVAVAEITKMQILELPLRAHVTREKEKDISKDPTVAEARKALQFMEAIRFGPETSGVATGKAIEAQRREWEANLAAAKEALAKAELAVRRETLGMGYLRKGITWIPEYTVKILNDDTAELSLRGTLVNEAEDLIHCDVSFVVGVPHFVHTDFMAPVAVGQVIRMIGSAVAPVQVQSQMMQRAAIVSNTLRTTTEMEVVDRPVDRPGGDVGSVLGSLPPLSGGAATDFTVYVKKDLTVRRGEKAIVSLFRTKIRYSHLYRWTTTGDMKHHLVLHNSTESAWTTGPALVVADGGPLSEDLLKYVPKGGSGELPVTTAINIAHERTEAEIDRKLKAYEPSHMFWVDLIKLKGTILLKNFEKRPVRVVIEAPIEGKPLSASDDGDIWVNTQKLQLLQREGTIRWTLELKPDEKKTLTFEYERYVPSR